MESRFSKEDKDRAIDRVINGGEKIKIVAQDLGCSDSLVSLWIRKYQWLNERAEEDYDVLPNEWEAIKRVVYDGQSVSIVARNLDIHPKLIFGWLKEFRDTDYDAVGKELVEQIRDKFIKEYIDSLADSEEDADIVFNSFKTSEETEELRVLYKTIGFIPTKEFEDSGLSQKDYFLRSVNTPIKNLNLSVRAYNILSRGGVRIISDAIKHTSLRRMRTAGDVSVQEICEACRKKGCYVTSWEMECKEKYTGELVYLSNSPEDSSPVGDDKIRMSAFPGVALISCADQISNGRTLEEQFYFYLKKPLTDFGLSIIAIRSIKRGIYRLFHQERAAVETVDSVEDVLVHVPSLMMLNGCGEWRQKEIISGFRNKGISVLRWEREFNTKFGSCDW